MGQLRNFVAGWGALESVLTG